MKEKEMYTTPECEEIRIRVESALLQASGFDSRQNESEGDIYDD